MQVEDMSMNFNMDFNIWSRPEWLRDEGTCQVNVTNFDAAVHLIPFNSEGRVQLEFKDAVITIEDFQVQFNGTSEIAEGMQLIVNKFKSFFKEELVNIVARKLTKSVEESINNYLLDDLMIREVGEKGSGIFQNLTMVGDPVLEENYLAVPYDGSFFVEGQNFSLS